MTDLAWSPEDRYLASVGLDSQVLIWSGYTLGAPFNIVDQSSFHHDMAILPSKNESAESINTMVSSRVFAGTQLGSFWQRSPTIAVSKSGVQWIGSSRLRFENLSRILLEAPFSDDSGETATSVSLESSFTFPLVGLRMVHISLLQMPLITRDLYLSRLLSPVTAGRQKLALLDMKTLWKWL